MDQKESIEKMKSLIQAGIAHEDDFIETYMQVIRNEGFMTHFGKFQEEAAALIDKMTEESRGHKQALEEIMSKLQ